MMENSEPQSKKKRKSKRKIDTEPVHEPVHEPVKVKVEVVRMDPNTMAPLVGYFPSGFDPVKQPGSTDVQVYRNPKDTRTELVVSPADCSVEFVGRNYDGEASSGHRWSYALGVFDKEAKTLKVMKIGADKVNL
jgi:DNA-directed RNA polymerase I subunit RPA49